MTEPPEEAKNPWRGIEFFVGALAVIALIGVVFELYGRYTYVHTQGSAVVRIDRVNGSSCTMPCDPDQEFMAAIPDPSPSQAQKSCHSANVVRVAESISVPGHRPPVPYRLGGFDRNSAVVQNWSKHMLHDAGELSDGHVYVFSKESFNAVSTWSTGQDVEVCATWSKIENRPFYSVGFGDAAEPAVLAL